MDFESARFNMIEQQIRPWDVHQPRVLELLSQVKREQFVGADQQQRAFVDTELPLANGGLMLQPKMEARMLQEAAISELDKVLEIGTGSGYLTALLAKMSSYVYSVEIDPAQQAIAQSHLKNAGIQNVSVLEGNGTFGLTDQAPFDVIMVGGSLPLLPKKLCYQLAINGRMIIVVGDLPVMTCKLVVRETENSFQETDLFETCLPRLLQSETVEPQRFVF